MQNLAEFKNNSWREERNKGEINISLHVLEDKVVLCEITNTSINVLLISKKRTKLYVKKKPILKSKCERKDGDASWFIRVLYDAIEKGWCVHIISCISGDGGEQL